MSEKTISIGFTNLEYNTIMEAAKNEGVSISQYIKSNINIISNVFNIRYKELVQKVLELPPNTIFTIKELWKKDEWNNFSRGIKLSLGKHFYKNVHDNTINNVSIKGYYKSGIMRYIKE